MKKFVYFLLIITVILLTAGNSFSYGDEEALKFFKKYVNAANNYDNSLLNMYSNGAKIIRQVLKPDGELVNVETNTETYFRQLKISSKVAKLRQYKNNYTNITTDKIDNGYKISAMRQPSGERYKLPFYIIIKKQQDGQWKIVEELMQTKVQTFLKYAK